MFRERMDGEDFFAIRIEMVGDAGMRIFRRLRRFMETVPGLFERLIPFPGRDATNQTNFQTIYDPPPC